MALPILQIDINSTYSSKFFDHKLIIFRILYVQISHKLYAVLHHGSVLGVGSGVLGGRCRLQRSVCVVGV